MSLLHASPKTVLAICVVNAILIALGGLQVAPLVMNLSVTRTYNPLSYYFLVFFLILLACIHLGVPFLVYFGLMRAMDAQRWNDAKIWGDFTGKLLLLGSFFGVWFLSPFDSLTGRLLHAGVMVVTSFSLLGLSKNPHT